MFWRRKRQPSPAFLVFGLGNPGLNYVRTRHNIGWWVLDELARRFGVEQTASRHRSQVDYCTIDGIRCALIKPTTFMNRSGQSVAAWLREHRDARWLVVVDDITMVPGKLRLRRIGSSGGHKGIQSIIDMTGGEEFDRLKIGVGNPPVEVDASNWVLEPPSRAEEDALAEAVQRAADAVALIAADDMRGAEHLMGTSGNATPV